MNDSKINLYLAIANCIMAIGTVWLALESYNLRKMIMGPNIFISDTIVEIIDNTNTAVKRISYRDGELLNETAINNPTSQIILDVKFSNSGSYAGFIVLSNADNLGQITGSSDKVGDYSRDLHLVSAGGETGWLYPYNIKSLMEKNLIGKIAKIVLPYQLEIYNQDLSFRNKLAINIRCFVNVLEDKTFKISCEPVGLLSEIKKSNFFIKKYLLSIWYLLF